MKSVLLERQQGYLDSALSTLAEGLIKFPSFDKLYMIKGQIHESLSQIPQAREAYAKGVKACPHSIPLWILSSRLEEKAGITIKARSLLEKARLLNPKEPLLWEESVRVEERAGSSAQAKAVLARGQSQFQPSICMFSADYIPYLLPPFPLNRSPGLSGCGQPLGHLHLERAPAPAQDQVGGCAQKDGRRSGHHRRHRPALLDRA